MTLYFFVKCSVCELFLGPRYTTVNQCVCGGEGEGGGERVSVTI